ncbi:hypothetical protein HV271_22555 [Citrobacter freundii]|uniref:hypothetical protein n=1 Tax=Citrobacter freundii TaxID=546 RepID=UPI0015EA88F7|nr:hypothetical protein [Citrobacter freundii]QLX27408.1 hypothetical protein HV271_22555 [Citrobacter freundii]
MGKYFDDYEREADYQSWVYYRESSHEDRESLRDHIQLGEKRSENVSEAEPQQSHVVNVFRDYPEHQALIIAAEKKYFESKRNVCDAEGDLDAD